jgi:cob(I)alamin adenosyltransferase
VKIYTKGGDTGLTSLIGGTRVAKNHPRVEAYGAVDELNAHIGVMGASLTDAALIELLHSIQEALMTLSAHLANDCSYQTLPSIKQESIEYLETFIDRMQEQLPPLNSFVLPGPPAAAAHCQVARAVCRRAERAVVALGAEETPPFIIVYLNRLSDFLFVLGRFVTLQQGVPEVYYHPNK